MCCEFSHACDDVLLHKLDTLGRDQYFLVCLGQLNYLYCTDKDTIESFRVLFLVEKIPLHIISDRDTRHILLMDETLTFQKHHGSKQLFKEFMALGKAA